MEPQATGEWFHCKVLNILTSCCRFVFYDNMDSFDIHFHWEKSKLHLHHHVIYMVCTRMEHSSRPISARKIFQFCKNFFFNKLSIIFTLLLQYYYNSATGQFLYWNAETQQYIPVAADGWVKLCLAMDVNFKIPDSFK